MKKGYRYSPEARAKMSRDRKGRRASQETKDKMKLSARKDSANNMWKGGITPISSLIRVCRKYKEWRKMIFERDNYTCVLCGKTRNCNLNADHYPITFSDILRTMISEQGIENAYEKSQTYPLFWDTSNGRTLCDKCHIIDHHKFKRKGLFDRQKSKPKIFITYNGETKTILEWSKVTGIDRDKIHHRYSKKMSPKQILSDSPVRGLFIDYMGEKRTLSEWCNKFKLPRKLIWNRLYQDKWTPKEAFNQSLDNHSILHKNIKKHDNRWIEYNGERKILFEWAEIFHLKPTILWKRLNRGWTIESAFTTPTGISRKIIHQLKKIAA